MIKTMWMLNPYLARLKPVVRGEIGVEAVVGLWLLDHLVLEEGGMGSQVLICEASANLADALVLLILWFVTGEKESSILARTLAFAKVASKDNEVKSVSDPFKVIFLQLQPIVRPASDFVGRVHIQRLHHQTLAVV